MLVICQVDHFQDPTLSSPKVVFEHARSLLRRLGHHAPWA